MSKPLANYSQDSHFRRKAKEAQKGRAICPMSQRKLSFHQSVPSGPGIVGTPVCSHRAISKGEGRRKGVCLMTQKNSQGNLMPEEVQVEPALKGNQEPTIHVNS